jgi:hypothetical protein
VDHRVALGSHLGQCLAPLAFRPPSEDKSGNGHGGEDDPPDHEPATSFTMTKEHLSISGSSNRRCADAVQKRERDVKISCR